MKIEIDNNTTVIIIDALIIIGVAVVAITTHTLWGLLFGFGWQSIESKKKDDD